ncbi:flagellar protein FliT [Pantoea sp. BRR-3P]|uniref:flagellar protein FliT n=1 Tax=Pantoea sp. BRR-3P TaxID=3141541 RepID=UPI0031F4EFE6
MQNKIMAQIMQLQEVNQQLQALASKEEWAAFSEQIGAYLAQMQALCQRDFTQEPETLTAQQLAALLTEDAQLRTLIKSRLSILSQDMSAMRKSRSSSQAYNAV